VNVSVPVSSSNTAAGVITSSPIIFNGGDVSRQTEFDPVSAGSTMLNVGTPVGFSTPSNRTSISVTVTASTSGIINTTPIVDTGNSASQTSNTQPSTGGGAFDWIMLILLALMNYIARAHIKSSRR
jgi:hypothetical protein